MTATSAIQTASTLDSFGLSIRSALKPRRAPRYFRLSALMAASSIAAASIGGCASAAPYNPSGLDSAQLNRVSDICQGVMGLSPRDPPRPVYGAADNPDLTDGENYYQGCVASLSSAMGRGDFAQAQVQADADCHAKGYQSGSPELARCVLDGERSGRVSSASYATFRPAPRSGRSYHNAGPSEGHRMIEQACAELGLNPIGGAFDSCVKDMTDTFFSIDNPRG